MKTKKIISIILSVMMLMSLVPTVSFAAATLDNQKITVAQDTIVRYGTNAEDIILDIAEGNSDNMNMYTHPEYGQYTFAYFSFKLPYIPANQVVSDAKFTLYGQFPGMSAGDEHKAYIYLVDQAWDETTLTWNNQPAALQAAYPANPDLTIYMPNSGSAWTEWTIDITSLVNKYLVSDYAGTVDFSIAIADDYARAGGGNNGDSTFIVNKTNSTYASFITVSTEELEEFALESTTPENNETIQPKDKVTFNFTNIIDDATVSASDFTVTAPSGATLEVADNEFSVSDKSVVLGKRWTEAGTYTVTLDGISDDFGQALSAPVSVSFVIEQSSVSAEPLANEKITVAQDTIVRYGTGAETIVLDAEGNSDNMNMYTHPEYGQHTFAYFSFKLPYIPANQVVSDAKFTLYGEFPGMSAGDEHKAYIYLVDQAWDETTLTWNSQPAALQAAYPANPDLTIYMPNSGSAWTEWTIDITSLVNKYLVSDYAGTVDFSIAIADDYTRAGGGNDGASTYIVNKTNSTYASFITVSTEEFAEFALESTTPENNETIQPKDKVTFNFTNIIDDATVSASDFTVTAPSGATLEVADNEFSVSDKSVVLGKRWTEAGTYTVTLDGISDDFGQALSAPVSVSFVIEQSSVSAEPLANEKITVAQDTIVRYGTGAETIVLDAEGNSDNMNMYTHPEYGQYTFAYFSFKLPYIPENQVVSDAKFTLYGEFPGMSAGDEHKAYIYLVDQAWDETTLTWNSQPAALQAAYPANPDLTIYMPNSGSAWTEWTIDITSLVNKYLVSDYAGTVDFSIAIADDYTRAGGGNNGGSTFIVNKTNSTYASFITVSTEELSSLALETSAPAIGATIDADDDVVFTFNNTIDASTVAASDFAVKDIAGQNVTVNEGDITVAGNTVTLSKTWEAYGIYTVALSGIFDIYGQALAPSAKTSFSVSAGANEGQTSFDVVSSAPAKGGVSYGLDGVVTMQLATTLSDDTATSDFIKLMNAKDNSVVEASVSHNAGTLVVTSAKALELYEEYYIVFKQGLKDTKGNTLASDKVVNRFETGVPFELFGIKFTLENAPVYDTMDTISSYNAGDTVTAVAKIKNHSAIGQDAIMLIALYDGNELISADVVGGEGYAAANATTQFAKTITVPSDASYTHIKAFVWDNCNSIKPFFPAATINQAQ